MIVEVGQLWATVTDMAVGDDKGRTLLYEERQIGTGRLCVCILCVYVGKLGNIHSTVFPSSPSLIPLHLVH